MRKTRRPKIIECRCSALSRKVGIGRKSTRPRGILIKMGNVGKSMKSRVV